MEFTFGDSEETDVSDESDFDELYKNKSSRKLLNKGFFLKILISIIYAPNYLSRPLSRHVDCIVVFILASFSEINTKIVKIS